MRFLLLFISIFGFAQEKESFYFDFNEYKFNSEQQEILQSWMNSNKDIEVVKVEGFCDRVGTAAYNDTLSYKRIKTVFEALESSVNISDVIEFKGFGNSFVQNKQQELNRRVDVYYNQLRKDVEKVVNKEEIKVVNLDSIVMNSKIGETIRLENLYFYNRSGIVVPKSKPVLIDLFEVLKRNPKIKIEIQGHICCQTGKDEEDIAKVRAVAVYNFLVKNGIARDRLRYKSFGSSKPVYQIPEKNDEERNANRRVEILILEK
ncbi:OmpA family protein [Flavobacterium chuncheonense]|uniref:OmpA family protein n=1 Tax=Flavobacterium chuncheonense TaxID=2026653 RepID=A0ABW5YRB7_9FLAO